MGNIQTGLLLMIVGMVTVFIILLIVIYGSELIIRLINRIAPEEVQKAKPTKEDPAVRQILDAAVAQITGGKGRIVGIKKI